MNTGLIESPIQAKVVNAGVRRSRVFNGRPRKRFGVAQANSSHRRSGKFLTPRSSALSGRFPRIDPKTWIINGHLPDAGRLCLDGADSLPRADDANRALMGSNMHASGLPLLAAEPPLVGTGVEEARRRDSGRRHYGSPRRPSGCRRRR